MPQPTSLYLTPDAPDAAPPPGPVRAVLRELEVIGEPLGDAVFRAGDGFSRHVVYAGCAPYLVMEPTTDGDAFCHVALHGPFARPRLVTGPNTVKPRCPACRTRFADWREQLAGWLAGATASCPGCSRAWSAHDLDWRGHAASGRVFVELRNVFPGEASPSDLLLERLGVATGIGWRHAWASALG